MWFFVQSHNAPGEMKTGDMQPDLVASAGSPVMKIDSALPSGRPEEALYTVQFGAFKDSLEAKRKLEELDQAGVRSYILPPNEKKEFYLVRAGAFGSFSSARAWERDIRRNLGIKDSTDTAVMQYEDPGQR